MRNGLAGLTIRGRAFIAAGISAVVCSVLLGQSALARIGVLVIVLPLVSAWVIGRARYRFALQRSITPQLVEAGQPARVELMLTNEGRTPTGVLLLEEQLPYVLGNRPRFVLEGIRRGWRRHVTYQVRSDVRGRFEIGPMTVRVNDPFGLVELGRSFASTVPLVVTPRIVPLPPIPVSGALLGSGDNRPRAFAAGSAEDVTVREYRQGDDLRRVHWRSSAKVGELMVRREEQPWQSRATLFLDNRTIAHQGHGVASSLEVAVSAAASIAVHLSQRGFAVRLVTAHGEDPSTVWHDRAASTNTGPLLESLAVLEPASHPFLETSWLAESSRSGLTVAILGAVADHDHGPLRRMHLHAASALAVALDVARWGNPSNPAAHREPAWLSAQGWRAVPLAPRDRLPEVWQELGRVSGTSRRTALTAGTPTRAAAVPTDLPTTDLSAAGRATTDSALR